MKYAKLLAAVWLAAATALPASAAQPDTVVRRFTAFSGDNGNAWRAVVHGKTMSIETAGEQYSHLRVQRSAYAKGAEFTGRTKHGEAVLNIRNRACRAHGKTHEFTATLYYRGQTLKGCAVRGAFRHAPT